MQSNPDNNVRFSRLSPEQRAMFEGMTPGFFVVMIGVGFLTMMEGWRVPAVIALPLGVLMLAAMMVIAVRRERSGTSRPGDAADRTAILLALPGSCFVFLNLPQPETLFVMIGGLVAVLIVKFMLRDPRVNRMWPGIVVTFGFWGIAITAFELADSAAAQRLPALQLIAFAVAVLAMLATLVVACFSIFPEVLAAKNSRDRQHASTDERGR